MKKCLILPVLFTLALHSMAQISILFVNDNDAFPYETDTVLNAMGRTTYSVDVFSAVDSLDAPTAAMMAGYDLVVWYAGVDGSSLQFWNGIDDDDPEVAAYLAGGGSMWIMGTDWLYDRYGTAGPTTFAAGDMVYDHCGIASYDSQSYADDGNTGCPQLDLATTLPLVGPATLTFIFPTTWYIDGVTPVPGAEPVYEMGSPFAGYPLQNEISGLYHEDPSSGSRVMTYLFNPAEITQTSDMIADFFERHFDFWNGVITSAQPSKEDKRLTVSPNPSEGIFRFDFEGKFQVMDAMGKLLLEGDGGAIDLAGYPAGIYLLRFTDGRTLRLLLR